MIHRNVLLRRISSKFLLLLTIIVGSYSFAAEEHSKQEHREYRLGVLLGFSGAGAIYSKDGLEAIKMAVDEINSKGGFLGKHKIRIIHKNTQTKANIAVREANGLILRDHVDAILGTYSSSCAIAIKPITHKNKVIHIAAISNSEKITLNNFSPYTFSVVPNSYMQARSVAIGVARIAKEKNWKRYATIASDYEWGHTTQQNFVSQLYAIAPEIKLTAEIWPRLGDPNYADNIAKIAKSDPDFVFGVIASKDNVRWIHFANSVGFFKKYPYPGSLISVSELQLHKDTIPRGIIGLARAPFFAHMDNERMKDFVNKYKQVYKKYPSDWAVLEYDAVYALKQGIEKAQSINSEKIKDALNGAEINTTRGELRFRKTDNQLICPSYLGIVKNSDKYPFPILDEMVIVSGEDSIRSKKEIIKLRHLNK
ncbi:MAG: hypothetical protein D6B27_12685 [Gammaproteobacteria bacterium]|nr:MAG: hypothetical protein D6B27_12685 [Gammaproteobacteria bacterium]